MPKTKYRPPIYLPNDRNLTLRIAAVRETFEESGILLLEKNGELVGKKQLPDIGELRKWRNIVSKDPASFFDLCSNLNARPRINHLIEWSNWMTPVGIASKRFDAAFYLTVIDHVPDYAAADGSEADLLSVKTPFEALNSAQKVKDFFQTFLRTY